MDISHWFPFGARYIRVSTIPATGFHLINDYTIVTSTFQHERPSNRSLSETLGISLKGNLVVMRHSSPRPMSVVSVHPAERRLIDVVIHR